MDLLLSSEDLAFRDEVRRFLADSIPPGMDRAIDLTTAFIVDPDVLIDFHRALHRKGWSVPHWPVEHGGTGWSPVQRYIFDLECGRAGAAIYNASGSHFVGPVIIHYGTQEQKNRYLPRIRSGDDYWAQGYSEPGSGSDLASLKTRAVADGDHYVVNGQKIWTTNAHRANRMFALVRTATTGKRQDGITFVLFDMDMPGITVRPIMGNGGDHEFNEVFFNDVRVPMSNRIGEENKGWEVAKFLLEFERGGRVLAGQVRAQFAKLVQLMIARGHDDSDLRTRLAEIGTDLDAMEMIDISVLSTLQTGGNPGPISSLLKLRWSEIRQSIAELAMDAIGDEALRWFPERPLYETLQLPPEDEEMAAMVP
ncbi:MAG: acyl-CoA dehydrogenase family protein, partial [Xanthobacteraceae bacterium]